MRKNIPMMSRELNDTDISFMDYKKQDIHGTALYPATMIAPLQKEVLERILQKTEVKSVLDPFCGSGTALYEAAALDSSLAICGCDINPLALLITRVKLEGVASRIKSEINLLKSELAAHEKEVIAPHDFPYIDKWFRADIKLSLTRLRDAIRKIRSKRSRRYLWYHFAVIVRRYGNSRSSTFKLHIKKAESIDNMVDNVVADFLSRVEGSVPFFQKPIRKAKLVKQDVLEWLPKQSDDAYDLTITSPPYGDNATTVTYGEFSWLPLSWIDEEDLEMDGWELINAHKIDSLSMGGSRIALGKNAPLSDKQADLLQPYLSKISPEKQKKVVNFFSDYFVFLDEISRVTRKYIVMTLGNRTVDRVQINLTDITARYLEKLGYRIEQRLTRPLVNKRIPKKTSCVKGEAVQSMNDEFVLIARNVCMED